MISPFFADEDLIDNLRTMFELEEMWTINFKALLNQIVEFNDTYLRLDYQGRIFLIHKLTGEVFEKEQ